MTRRTLRAGVETWPLKHTFRISRGAKSEAIVVVTEIAEGDFQGRGECVPYARYGETPQSVLNAIESQRSAIESGFTREELQQTLPAGAARNALDCALIDLEAKLSARPVYELLGLPNPKPVRTAITISIASPEAMARTAAGAQDSETIKIKLSGDGDLDRVRAIRSAAPKSKLIADANEALTMENLAALAPELAKLDVALIEQPLKADADEALARFKCPIPLCADESCHTRQDLARLRGRYAMVNIKLDKTGGLTEAVAMAHEAKAQGFGIMLGCMVATSLSIAPAMLLAPFADFIDLDGPLWLARDRAPSLHYDGDRLQPPTPELWG